MKHFEKYLIGAILLISLGSASRFDISSVSTCTQQSENGFCTRW